MVISAAVASGGEVYAQLPQAGQVQPDLTSIETTAHRTYRLSRPTDYKDYVSLEEWVKANYTRYLVPETLKRDSEGEHETVTFVTRADDGTYDHHVLSEDDNGTFVLQTTADIKTSTESNDVLVTAPEVEPRMMAPKASSAPSCATGMTNGVQNACDCVYYVRCLIPSFPRPATYYTEKLKAINTYVPSIGAAAIMNISPPWGHVAVINGMWWNWHGYIADLIVMLNEANYRACQVTTTRNGTPASMQIVGYYRP